MKYIFLCILLCGNVFAAPLDDLRATGAVVSVKKITPKRLQSLSEAEDRYLLSGLIEIDSAAEFEKVKTLLMKGSTLTYSGKKTYPLKDFLPPVARALVNRVFEVKSWETDALRPYLDKPEYGDDPVLWFLIKNGLGSFSNCWNTTVELIRSVHPHWDQEVMLYWPGRDVVTYTMRDKAYSVLVPESKARPGDVLIISRKSELNQDGEGQHTAVLFSKDVVFEKTDSSENDPWRMSLLSDVVKKYKRIFGKEFKMEFRRFEGKTIFPHFSSTEDQLGVAKLIKKYIPGVDPNFLNMGCETGLGGGCDGIVTVVESFKLANGQLTGNDSARQRIIQIPGVD